MTAPETGKLFLLICYGNLVIRGVSPNCVNKVQIPQQPRSVIGFGNFGSESPGCVCKWCLDWEKEESIAPALNWRVFLTETEQIAWQTFPI